MHKTRINGFAFRTRWITSSTQAVIDNKSPNYSRTIRWFQPMVAGGFIKTKVSCFGNIKKSWNSNRTLLCTKYNIRSYKFCSFDFNYKIRITKITKFPHKILEIIFNELHFFSSYIIFISSSVFFPLVIHCCCFEPKKQEVNPARVLSINLNSISYILLIQQSNPPTDLTTNHLVNHLNRISISFYKIKHMKWCGGFLQVVHGKCHPFKRSYQTMLFCFAWTQRYDLLAATLPIFRLNLIANVA